MLRTMKEINATIKELAEYSRMADELAAQIDTLKDELKAYMTEAEVDELLGENGEHVIWKPVISNKFDSTAFKKSEWGELYKMYTKQTETKPFKFYA